jgi:excisionase family DNA binding protein
VSWAPGLYGGAMSTHAGDDMLDFSRRARRRLACGESLVVAVGDDRVTLGSGPADGVLTALDRTAGPEAEPTAPTAPVAAFASEPVADPASAAASIPEATGEISTGQAADLLGVSRRTIVQLIERGDLDATRIGTRRRLEAADVLTLRERARSERQATLRDVVAASRDLDLYR